LNNAADSGNFNHKFVLKCIIPREVGIMYKIVNHKHVIKISQTQFTNKYVNQSNTAMNFVNDSYVYIQ